MAVVAKNLWATIKELLIEQYRGNLRSEIEAGTYTDKEGEERHYSLPEGADNRFQGVLKSLMDVLMQPLDDAAVAARNAADLDAASGEWLDVLGKLVGLTRNYQETDTSFRNRIKEELSRNNAGTPDGVIYSAAILSQDPAPQYMDEAPATFFVYDGPRPGDTDSDPWGEGGRQLSRAQVRKLAPAGALGLPGAVIQLYDGSFLGIEVADQRAATPVLTEGGQRVLTEDGKYVTTEVPPEGRRRKMFVVVANDRDITREVLLADNNGSIVVSPNSVPVRVVLTGPTVPSIPTIETEWNGVPVDAVRIKDLPDAEYDSAYMVRDSDAGGTTKIDESEVGIQMKPSGTNTLKFYRRGPTAESDTEG